MKLRTKFQDEDFELGEVVNADVATMPDGRIKLQAEAMVGGLHTFFYDRLEKFYNEWEDYEEAPRKEVKEETETWDPGGVIRTSIGFLAAEDYYEILEDGTKKTEFTWDEAMEIEKKTNGKWRLPTIFEWDKLVAEFGDKNGKLDRDAFVLALDLTEDEDGYGLYWASTANSNSNYAYDLSLSSGLVSRDYYYRYDGNSVRLLRGEE